MRYLSTHPALASLAQSADLPDGDAPLSLEKESTRRLDGLVATVERLSASAGQKVPSIREDLDSLESLRTDPFPASNCEPCDRQPGTMEAHSGGEVRSRLTERGKLRPERRLEQGVTQAPAVSRL
jgi:hypothetical protein